MTCPTLSTETQNEGRAIFLMENGVKVGSAWTGPTGTIGFALHMNAGYGPFYEGQSEDMQGALTDLVAAYWKWTGNNAAFPS